MTQFFQSNVMLELSQNRLRRSYQILERHPHLIRIDPHLQVMCYQFKCHPTWWPGYRNRSLHHLSSNITFDWKNDTYVITWTNPTPYELNNPKNFVAFDRHVCRNWKIHTG